MNTITTTQSVNEEIQAFCDLAKNFADKELIKNREEHDHYPFAPLFTGSMQNAGEVGFYGINLPAEFGGIGMGETALASVLENISKEDASMAGIVFTNAAALEIINQASLDADCSKIYEMLNAKQAFPLSFHSFEAPGEMELPVVDSKGLISGKINFLVLGGTSPYTIIPARTKDKSVSYYLIDLNASGVIKSETVYSIGLHACPGADVELEKAQAILIGKAGEGMKYFQAMQSHLSIGAAAISLGIMKGSFRDALQYTKDRFQGGRQIIDWPETRMMLSNMAIEIEVGQSCLAQACSRQDTGEQAWERAARAAAIHVAEMSRRTTNDGVQLLGGCGYMKDYPQEKRMRDAHQVLCLLGMSLVRKMDFINGIIAESE